MKLDITCSYGIDLYPDEDDLYDCIHCSMSFHSTGPDSVAFTIRIGRYDYIRCLAGFNSAGFWFLDPFLHCGFCMDIPVCYDSVYDEMTKLLEYDTEQCIFLARSIELILKDQFNVTLSQEKTEFPF